ncbi:MAG: CaiB/BaiF CoA-transferase family protein [Bacteroidota bacterium]
MFTDLKIIELASVLAGPSVGQFFAELGAEVIKIENPKTKGDVTRSWKVKGEDSSDRSAYFTSTNWGKKSLTLDISQIEGLKVLHRLAVEADIVIASYKPGDAKKLKVDYETLSGRNSKLIYGEITGYGADIKRVGYDAIIQAESGFMYMNGQADGPPTKMPVALVDVLAGHHLKEAILLALIHRMKTGEGRHVSVSLMDAAISSLVNQAANYLITGVDPRRKGSIHPNIAPYGEIFETRDEKQLILAVGNNKQFNKLCKVLGLHQLIEDKLFTTSPSRVKNRTLLGDQLKSEISQVESDVLMKELNANQIPAGIITSVADALEHQDIASIKLQSNDLLGLRGFAASGLEISSHILPPPGLGEHNNAILTQELGFNTNEIKGLSERGII